MDCILNMWLSSFVQFYLSNVPRLLLALVYIVIVYFRDHRQFLTTKLIIQYYKTKKNFR